MTRLRLATRSSPQARTQSEAVAAILVGRHPGLEVDLVAVDTLGDRRTDVALHTIGGQGVFVKEVQAAVLDGRADLAVHSAKDLPSVTTPGLTIGAFGARRDPRDALVGARLADLAPGATVATGSVRRRAQLTGQRPDLTFVELRGNIATRLSRIPDAGAIVMAMAALEVLGITEEVATRHGLEPLDPEVMVPMVGQGCVAVEHRDEDDLAREVLAAVDDAATRRAVEIERAFLAELGSGCSLPVAAHLDQGVLRCYLADPGAGTEATETILVEHLSMPRAREVAAEAARSLRARVS